MTTAARGPRAARRDHAWIDERSHALHSRIAEKLRARPELLAVASENLDRWERVRGRDSALDEWKTLLKAMPLPAPPRLLTDEGEETDRLRQSSPFAGVLTEEERSAVFRHDETF